MALPLPSITQRNVSIIHEGRKWDSNVEMWYIDRDNPILSESKKKEKKRRSYHDIRRSKCRMFKDSRDVCRENLSRSLKLRFLLHLKLRISSTLRVSNFWHYFTGNKYQQQRGSEAKMKKKKNIWVIQKEIQNIHHGTFTPLVLQLQVFLCKACWEEYRKKTKELYSCLESVIFYS